MSSSMFLILQKFVVKRSVLLNYTDLDALDALDALMHLMRWMDLCAGLLYEHRFAVLINVTCTKLFIVRTAVFILRTQAVALASQ